jgi:hypothetical protein
MKLITNYNAETRLIGTGAWQIIGHAHGLACSVIREELINWSR